MKISWFGFGALKKPVFRQGSEKAAISCGCRNSDTYASLSLQILTQALYLLCVASCRTEISQIDQSEVNL